MLKSFRVLSRHRLAIHAWHAMIVSRTGESRTLIPQGNELYFKQYCVILSYRILCCGRLVMSDSSVVVVSRFY